MHPSGILTEFKFSGKMIGRRRVGVQGKARLGDSVVGREGPGSDVGRRARRGAHGSRMVRVGCWRLTSHSF